MKIKGTITSLEEFNSLVEEVRRRRYITTERNLPMRWEFYRGQLDINWNIIPGIARGLNNEDQIRKAELAIMSHFKSEIRRQNYLHKIYIDKSYHGFEEEWAWLRQAQHYGIPTRLLDWSAKPDVALYFAVDNPNFDHIDGQFLILYYPMYDTATEGRDEGIYRQSHYSDLSKTWFINPYFGDRTDDNVAEIRRARQHGKFTIQPYNLALQPLNLQEMSDRDYWMGNYVDPVIEKYIIPARYKADLRLQLIADGWHEKYLYVIDYVVIKEIALECRQILMAFCQP